MQVTTGTTAAVGAQTSHTRQPTFGSLVSAIRRGDIEAAGGAFDALQKLAPDRPGWSRKGPLETIGEALKTGGIEAARAALKDFQQATAIAPDGAEPAQRNAPVRPGSTIDILV